MSSTVNIKDETTHNFFDSSDQGQYPDSRSDAKAKSSYVQI